jgi:uncharacterized membrane protein YqjE
MGRGNGRVTAGFTGGDPSLGDLFGQLSSDAQLLVRKEVELAKAELREAGSTLARDGAKIGVAVALALLGAFAATAFAIVGLGALIDNYWASALIVTIVLFAVAAFLGKGAMNDIKRRGVKPTETLETLREDADWAKREARSLKQDLTAQRTN